MEAFRRRVAVHPAWRAAARAFDGFGWMHVCGTACSHLGDDSVSRRCRYGGNGRPSVWMGACVCSSRLWLVQWWSMATWLARSKLALLAAELCVRLHIS